MEQETTVAIIGVSFFAAIVLSIFFIMKYRAIGRPEGIDFNESIKRKTNWQKPGIVVIGMGVGVLITGFLRDYSNVNNDAINVGIVAICTGVSMIIANSLEKRKSAEEQ